MNWVLCAALRMRRKMSLPEQARSRNVPISVPATASVVIAYGRDAIGQA